MPPVVAVVLDLLSVDGLRCPSSWWCALGAVSGLRRVCPVWVFASHSAEVGTLWWVSAGPAARAQPSVSLRSIASKILLGFTVFLSLIWVPFLVSMYM